MTGPMTLILPDLIHEFETISCRATFQIAYTYQPREEDDVETATYPVYPESVEIDSVKCVAFDILYDTGDVFSAFAGSVILPLLNEDAVALFQVEVADDRLQAMCLKDARNRQESNDEGKRK